ncbi:MAG: hypothetical protein LBL72_00665 [Candidatus Accumulibacter sp.]|jgi:hypothetical protein|nr:hypothetical protein [Accumulibacter sp.]
MNIDPLIAELKKAHALASQFTGGYSARFMSAEEFAHALAQTIAELEAGNTAALKKLNLWFLPTSDWDDFVKLEGMELGQRISDMLRAQT